MKTDRKETRFERIAKRFLMFIFAIFIIGVVGLSSYESSLNIDSQNIEKEIANELELREKFVKKFDINYLINMDYDDYVIGKLNIEESGKESFCYLTYRFNCREKRIYI